MSEKNKARWFVTLMSASALSLCIMVDWKIALGLFLWQWAMNVNDAML